MSRAPGSLFSLIRSARFSHSCAHFYSACLPSGELKRRTAKDSTRTLLGSCSPADNWEGILRGNPAGTQALF
ncbi:hypothetical protein BDZ89DRAFT_1074122 [Hymenopellis radicata]|nr:hypothetical protein BDZ89DRAFT_1074122 [Hymenopellis radicata]